MKDVPIISPVRRRASLGSALAKLPPVIVVRGCFYVFLQAIHSRTGKCGKMLSKGSASFKKYIKKEKIDINFIELLHAGETWNVSVKNASWLQLCDI